MTTNGAEGCLCGCGGAPKKGSFLPGHDAKYKSFLINEALGGNNPEAEAALEARGWTKFLIKKREMASRPKTVRKESRVRKPIEVLRLMKAASKVLKWTDQYRRGTLYSITLTPDNAGAIAIREYPELRIPTDGTEPEPFTPDEQRVVDAFLADSARM